MSWQDELEAILKELPGYNPWDQQGDSWLDHDAALAAINWFPEHLKHVEGTARGEPFVLRRWQAAIVGNIFGWKRKDDAGRVVRRYRQSFIEVGRGNGKTPLASGIVLYAFYNDNEPGAQCYLAAGQREQAGVLFRNAAGMVDQDAELSGRVTIYRGDQHRSMTLKDDPLSFIKVIPADAAGQHGGIPHVSVVDEVHVQESRDLLDVFETGMAKRVRSQPLLVLITTSDYDRPSVCNEVEDYATKVRDNGGDKAKPGYDPAFLPVLFKVPDDADWRDEAKWPLANPNLDVSVSRESLRKACQKAIETPAFENAFRRLHLNQKTSQAVRLIRMEAWDKCKGTLTLEDMRGLPCWAGMDIASKEDLCSLALVFRLRDGRLALFVWVFCNEAKVAARARKKYPYDVWAKQAWLTVTPGNSTDYAAIRAKIVELDRLFQITKLYVDPHDARETCTMLMEQHGFQDRLVEITQNMGNLSGPTKDLIFRVKNGTILHDGNPVLRWAVSNLAGKFQGTIPQGELLEDFLDKVPVIPSKQTSADKIDPVAATVNALAAMATYPAAAAQPMVTLL